MVETQHPYDVARRLDQHFQNLANTNGQQAGDCSRCAALMCRTNITRLAIVQAIEADPLTNEIKYDNCEDQVDDPEVPADLGMIKDYEKTP